MQSCSRYVSLLSKGCIECAEVEHHIWNKTNGCNYDFRHANYKITGNGLCGLPKYLKLTNTSNEVCLKRAKIEATILGSSPTLSYLLVLCLRVYSLTIMWLNVYVDSQYIATHHQI